MKKHGTLIVTLLFAIAVVSQLSFKNHHPESVNDTQEEYKFPKKVQAVIDKSCYGCHSEKGKSDDAKKALRWDKMGEYDNAKLVSIMDEIIEVVDEEKMPPEKMVEKKPEIKPTEKEYQTLAKWAEKEADKLLK